MFEEATIDIPCRKCGHQTPKTIAWLKANSEFDCRGCGSHIFLENVEELIATLDETEDAVLTLSKDAPGEGEATH